MGNHPSADFYYSKDSPMENPPSSDFYYYYPTMADLFYLTP
ncbi:MAG TPA: hypothetical protein VGD14_16095 [bacterium]